MRSNATALLVGALLALAGAVAPAAPARASLPRISIDAPAGIQDEPKRAATIRTRGFAGQIGIELRGSSSMTFPKKSYSLEIRQPSGEAHNVSLLGLPKDDDWVLLATYNDKSLMRNALAYSAARQLGRYAPRTRYVELELDGRYQGVYVLAEQLKIKDNRVAVEEKGLSGGYLLEMKSQSKLHSGDRYFRTPVRRRAVVYTDPDHGKLSRKEAAWISRYIRGFERALYRRSPRAGRGYRAYLDVSAAVDFVLLNELFKNPDTFLHSAYMHKGAGGKLVLGPLWDFDVAMGNSTFGPSRATRGWLYAGYDWARRLYRDPDFRSRMARRWRAVRRGGLLAHLLREIRAASRELRRAQARNFRRWPILGHQTFMNPPDPRTGRLPRTWRAETDYLRWWITKRARWIDRNVGRLRG